jgi:signal transduction histidine kinase
MLKLQNFFDFMEESFDYLLVLDGDGKVMHASKEIVSDGFPDVEQIEGKSIEELLTSSSVETVRSAMIQAKAGTRGVVVLSREDDGSSTVPLKAGHFVAEKGDVYPLFGNRLEGLVKGDEWEKDERIKELACLYSVAELIEVSASIPDFFTRLPKTLGQGMLYPDEVVIYSMYTGVEYGQKPSSRDQIRVPLIVAKEEKGEILVGYHNDDHELLPEEHKLLEEIGRMLMVALERKEFGEKLHMMEEEEEDYNRRLDQLRSEIEAKTKDLEEQKSKLSIVDSYLDRVKGGWEESKSRLETMFKAIPDDVVLIDKKRKVIMTNREDIEPGNYCYTSYFHRDKPCEDCRLARILRDKTPVSLTMKVGERYIQVQAQPVFNQDHEVDGILEFYRDITLEKTYDQQLQQADKLASIGQLVSGIGHEINNPNQFIRGNIKIIQQSLDDMLPIVDDYVKEHPDLKIARLNYDFFREHIMTLVDDMAHGSERIKAIVEGLRTFTRKDEGLLVDKVDINTLIETAARLVHNEVHKTADIELGLSPDVPAFTGNSQKIEQVLINLIVNASQAIPDDRRGLIRVSTNYENERITVLVEDNGKGMNESTVNQIFNPFFTTKRAKGGTGLGLAIAYRIIEEHNGKIQVKSKPGVGTTFIIRIPTLQFAPSSEEQK